MLEIHSFTLILGVFHNLEILAVPFLPVRSRSPSPDVPQHRQHRLVCGEGGKGAEVALQDHHGQPWHSPGTPSSSPACVAASQLRHWLGWHRSLHN